VTGTNGVVPPTADTIRLASTQEWRSVCTRHHCMLLEGPEDVTETVLLHLKPHLRTPVVWTCSQLPRDFPAGLCGALVLRDVAALGRKEQERLLGWLDAPHGPLQGVHTAMSTSVLLLAGVTLNSFLSAIIMFVQYIADFAQVYRAARWIMGDLDIGGYDTLIASLPLVLGAYVLFAWLPASLNLLSVGKDAAAARGVDVPRAQRLAFLSASLATSAAVSLAGPIGFVGIVVPHLVRLLVGVDHRIVLPASALFGAAFLVACDLLARTILAPIEIPVGVVTAMIGGPFFLWLLVRKS